MIVYSLHPSTADENGWIATAENDDGTLLAELEWIYHPRCIRFHPNTPCIQLELIHWKNLTYNTGAWIRSLGKDLLVYSLRSLSKELALANTVLLGVLVLGDVLPYYERLGWILWKDVRSSLAPDAVIATARIDTFN